MPTVRRSRRMNASTDALWRVVADPHHLPRWWPKVGRVEGVDSGAWTTVMTTDKGKMVRADYRLMESADRKRRRWAQELEGTPFERLMTQAETEVRFKPGDGGTDVTIEQEQKLRGMARFGGFMFRRATRKLLDEALDGLENASGG